VHVTTSAATSALATQPAWRTRSTRHHPPKEA
jgi:hypothetical protein